MKQIEKIAVGVAIIAIAYMVFKDDKKDDKDEKGVTYEYGRRDKAKGGGYVPWKRKQGSRSGS